jgi:hypothetical protein
MRSFTLAYFPKKRRKKAQFPASFSKGIGTPSKYNPARR